jgi:hypothetical protein
MTFTKVRPTPIFTAIKPAISVLVFFSLAMTTRSFRPPWPGSGRLLQQGGRNTGSDCIPATPIDAFVGEVIPNASWLRTSQDARRSDN